MDQTDDIVKHQRTRILLCLLIAGGVIGVTDPLWNVRMPAARSALVALAGLLLWGLAWFLHLTKALSGVIYAAVAIVSLVFLGDFVRTSDPFFFVLGFAVPLAAAMLMTTRAAVITTAGYCVIGLGVGVAIHFGLLDYSKAGDELSTMQQTVSAILIIAAIAAATIWKEWMFVAATRGECSQRVRLQTICDHGYDAIFETDTDGVITYANGKLIELLGYQAKDLLGRKQLDLVKKDDRESLETRIQGKDKYDAETRLVDSRGEERWIRISGGAFTDTDQRQKYVNAIQDIQEKVTQREQVFELSRLESLGTVCGGLAHDFNNLLTVIGIQAEMIGDRQIRQEILQAQRQASNLTAGLLTFARKQDFRDRNVLLSECLNSSKPLIERMLPANIQCFWDVDDEDTIVRIDPSQFQQVLLNLVTNSQHAMADGGKLTIMATRTDVLPDAAIDETVTHGKYATLIVSDTGAGMDAATVQRAVEPFFTTKPRGKGTGMGLATVHGVVLRANGAMHITSEPGLGTSISIYLPIQPSAEVTPDDSNSGSVVDLSGLDRRVMLIDDREEVANVVCRLLEKAGFKVTVKSNAEDGWDLLSRGERFDLLITDVVLPGMSGVDLVRRVIESESRTKVILISGHQQERLTVIAEHPETLRFLPKPFASKDLLQVANELLSIS